MGESILTCNWYMRDNIARAIALGLHKCEPKKVLDIGFWSWLFFCLYANISIIMLQGWICQIINFTMTCLMS